MDFSCSSIKPTIQIEVFINWGELFSLHKVMLCCEKSIFFLISLHHHHSAPSLVLALAPSPSSWRANWFGVWRKWTPKQRPGTAPARSPRKSTQAALPLDARGQRRRRSSRRGRRCSSRHGQWRRSGRSRLGPWARGGSRSFPRRQRGLWEERRKGWVEPGTD